RRRQIDLRRDRAERKAIYAVSVRRDDVGHLVLLRHKRLSSVLRGALQHGHRTRLLARATVRRRRMVAIEFEMCRSGRIGGASGSVTVGNGKRREFLGDTWS